MKIAVTGATGRLGTPLVEILTEQGHEVVAISRSNGVDVITGEGLAEALAGAEVIIDAATGPSPDYESASTFFNTEVRNLQAHAKDAKRIVLISIIGVDRFTGGYNRAKFEQERAHLAGTVEVKILRAAQFHEFVEPLLQWMPQENGVRYVPEMQTQLVAARAVAEALVDLAANGAAATDAGRIPEIAGPRAETLVDVATLLAERTGESVRIEGVTDPADPDAALYERGALLPGPDATLAGPTYEEWLDGEART
jgi:uncharacterized protein YbjT (DUF2867 family)